MSIKTINDFIRYAITTLNASDVYFGHNFDNAYDEARFLTREFLNLPLDKFDEFLNCNLEKNELENLLNLLNARIEDKKPSAYLLSKMNFCGFDFYVNEDVLIPRSPIGYLLMNNFLDKYIPQNAKILDICTGSGCLGLLASFKYENTNVYLSDISINAIEVANTNIELHNKQEQVVSILSDGFNDIKGEFDFIICNPPYVDLDDFNSMPDEYKFEPELALFGGEDGLNLVHKLLKDAKNHLTENGYLLMEVGNSHLALQEQYDTSNWFFFDKEVGEKGIFVVQKQFLPN